jgi:hypothetical protein
MRRGQGDIAATGCDVTERPLDVLSGSPATRAKMPDGYFQRANLTRYNALS